MNFFEQLTCGAQIERVGEHPGQPSTLFIFEYKCYPEAKILSNVELTALRQEFGDWYRVAELLGASEAIVRQNSKT